MRERLWLADKNAVAGMSRIDPLTAGPTKAKSAAAKKRTPSPVSTIGRKPKFALPHRFAVSRAKQDHADPSPQKRLDGQGTNISCEK
jgi:hypothetical protein